MVLTLIFLAATQQANGIGDFFPTVAGTVRTYKTTKGHKGDTVVNTVGKPLDMGGVPIFPITEDTGAGKGKTTYYRIEDNQVSIVAYDVTNPLPSPMPVMKLGTGTVSWTFEGKTSTGPKGEPLRSTGEARLAGQRKVLGKNVDVLEVVLKAVVGSGLSGVMYKQTAFYGRGLGLIEMRTAMTLGKRTQETWFSIDDIAPSK